MSALRVLIGSAALGDGPLRVRRRALLLVAILVGGAWGPNHSIAAEESEAKPHVSVRHDRGVYTVSAEFTISQPPAVVVAVLTDYDQIPRFLPEVRTSKVLERTGHRVVVEQEAVARFMLFSKRLHLVLEVIEEPLAIRFRDRCGKSFARYEGAWQITDETGRVAITYALTAKPSFDVPEFVLKRLLARDASRMIQNLRVEFANRVPSRSPVR